MKAFVNKFSKEWLEIHVNFESTDFTSTKYPILFEDSVTIGNIISQHRENGFQMDEKDFKNVELITVGIVAGDLRNDDLTEVYQSFRGKKLGHNHFYLYPDKPTGGVSIDVYY